MRIYHQKIPLFPPARVVYQIYALSKKALHRAHSRNLGFFLHVVLKQYGPIVFDHTKLSKSPNLTESCNN